MKIFILYMLFFVTHLAYADSYDKEVFITDDAMIEQQKQRIYALEKYQTCIERLSWYQPNSICRYHKYVFGKNQVATAME
jgi:hypothetical protein